MTHGPIPKEQLHEAAQQGIDSADELIAVRGDRLYGTIHALLELYDQYPEGRLACYVVMMMQEAEPKPVTEEESLWFARGAIAQAKATESFRLRQE